MEHTRPRLLLLAAAAALLPAAAAAQTAGQTFVLEGAVIDSRSASSLGITRESGEIAALFRAQKALTFGILRAAGIPLDSLPADVRARIERFQTTNVEAFRAYSNGLDLKDQGRFAEARAQFQRAAELDPGFALAAEQQQAMPEVTLGTGVQIRAVVAAAAGQAVDRGRAGYALDAARAVAALQAGQTVALAPASDAAALSGDRSNEFSTNAAGSGVQYVPNLAAGLAFARAEAGQPVLGLALSGEWKGGEYQVDNGALDAVGSSGSVFAVRQGATQGPVGSTALADGSSVYWGQWLSAPGASATVAVGNTVFTAPEMTTLHWIAGDATRQMPGTGTAVFTPAGGGNLTGVSGQVAVDFLNRGVAVQNLGFTLDGLAFTGLNGSASYSDRALSGGFVGNYTSGNCTGCVGFIAESSAFGGNFVGKNADGLIFSTVLVTDGGTRGGTTLLKKGP